MYKERARRRAAEVSIICTLNAYLFQFLSSEGDIFPNTLFAPSSY